MQSQLLKRKSFGFSMLFVVLLLIQDCAFIFKHQVSHVVVVVQAATPIDGSRHIHIIKSSRRGWLPQHQAFFLLKSQLQPKSTPTPTPTSTTITTIRGGGATSPNSASSYSSLSQSSPSSSVEFVNSINSNNDADDGGSPRKRLQFVFMDEDSPLVQILAGLTRCLLLVGQTLLPPLVGTIKAIARFYSSLSGDVISLQVGTVYAFLGGYYPTLFSALQAARNSGWNVMVRSINDITYEAMKVLDEASLDDDITFDSSRQSFLYHTNLVLKTVDPNKINTAVAALYTSWLAITAVLKQEYARVINLSLTLANGLERAVELLIQPIFQLFIPQDYHQWIPFVLGWVCKGIAMNFAWKMQRVLTASSSAIVGGRIVAKSLLRLTKKAWIRFTQKRGQKNQDSVQQQQHRRRRKMKYNHRQSYELEYYDIDENDLFDDDLYYDGQGPTSVLEEMITYTVGGIGFWTQMETQIKNNFSFEVPFPLSLVTWPFDLAENAIQWYITDEE